jgi:hypothetical protein
MTLYGAMRQCYPHQGAGSAILTSSLVATFVITLMRRSPSASPDRKRSQTLIVGSTMSPPHLHKACLCLHPVILEAYIDSQRMLRQGGRKKEEREGGRAMRRTRRIP